MGVIYDKVILPKISSYLVEKPKFWL